MAQFGGNKNPPWAPQGGHAAAGTNRGTGAGALDVPGLVGAFGAAAAQAGPPVFQGTPGIPPGLAGVGHLGVPGAGHGPAVTLAAMAGQPGVYPRALGPAGGFPGGPLLQQQQPPQPQQLQLVQQQPPPQHQQGQGPQQQQQQQTSQRVFTGTVTKLHDNFGFVDEDVFFQTSVVKGQAPRVNDRVLVEAAYNANMPFKWNATRIQVLPNQNAGGRGGPPPGVQTSQPSTASVTTTSSLNAHAFTNAPPMSHPPPPRMGQPQQRNEAAFGGGGGGSMREHRNSESNSNSMRMRNSPPREMKRMSSSNDHRRRDDRSNTRDRERDRDRSRDKDRGMPSRSSPPPPNVRKRSRSPRRTRSRSRSRSPPRRRARTAPRYNVSVPKVALNFPESSVYELKKRYSNMYVPSDFFMADHSWMTSFPVHDGFRIQYASTFHIFNKELVESPLLSDAVYDPTDADHSFNAKVMLMAVPPPDVLIEKTCQLAESSATNRDNLVHPTRAIQFLVGTRGKNETLAIGGPWSPSLDGPNPESDPSVLIRTAIRVCRALTGIDLSTCTQWHRFLEIHYRRQESSTKPARTETTVIFLPDIWSVMPTPDEHGDCRSLYEKALETKINPPPPAPEPEIESETVEKVEEEPPKDTDESVDEKTDDNETENDTNGTEENPEPTHWSNIDIKSMKVNELRSELEARGLNSKGLKSQLAARLQEAVNEEEQNGDQSKEMPSEGNENVDNPTNKDDEKQSSKPDEPEVMEIDEKIEKTTPKKEKPPPPKELDEKQKQALKNAYRFPNDPCILVHPHPKAKSGKFDCTVMSLSVLLDYRTEDNKESTFEVSLFAELFNEMLMRDSGFKMYKALVNASEKPIEEKSKPENNEQSNNEGENNKSEDNTENNEKDSSDTKSSTKKKVITKDKDLLLACSYFDLGHCGYFETKDLEDILTTMNLNLSRAQIKKLLTKVTSGKDLQVNYRQFTDKSEDEELLSYLESDDETLGQGFRAYLNSSRRKTSNGSSKTVSVASEGICNYRGSVVDVAKLLGQLKRSEKARSDTESQLKLSQKTTSDLQNSADRHAVVKEKLQAEVKDLKKQLKRVEDDMKRSQTDSSKYYTILKDIYSKVHPAVNAPTSPTPSKESIKKEELDDTINGKIEAEEAK